MEKYIEYIKNIHLNNYISYNSKVILSFFFICLIAFILNTITKGKSNKLLFSNYRSSPLNPLTYIRLFTHIIGHSNWQHLKRNFLYILLVGPLVEEKYGSINLLIMILLTAFITGLINIIIGKYKILGSSDIVYMLIILSSIVNINKGTIPLTLILIIIFYIIDEILQINKSDNVSHLSHLIGAICGCIYGFYIL
jgi:rhomboid protease GluP